MGFKNTCWRRLPCYYPILGNKIILLLCGGSKNSQQQDIQKATEYLKKYKEEHKW